MTTDEIYRQLGYERISLDMTTEIDGATHHGIDGVYYNPNGHPPYIIAEAKYGGSRLSYLKGGTKQMDSNWIGSRLEKAVGEEHYDLIRKAKKTGDVQAQLVKIQKNGNIVINNLDAEANIIKPQQKEEVMIRDKHKDQAYFERRLNRLQKRLREDVEMTNEISEKYLLLHYQDLVLDNEELVKLSYSIGASKEEIFPYYQGVLSNLKLIASEGVPFDLAVNIFSLGVLYSERKEEFLDDLKAIYEQMDHTDGLIEYFMVYLFHDKIVPFHSILEYQNMIEDTYESVAKAQGFWYYSHSDEPWYGTHKYDNRGYDGYWSFDTAATCKIKGIYDERLKDLEYFPYDLLVQEN